MRRDLVAVAERRATAGFTVALVEQPYRVAGRRSAAPARQLDAAWIAVVEQLRAGASQAPARDGRAVPGARVACRTAEATGAVAVLCLAFPLVPPRRDPRPPKSRQPELDAVEVPVLVVQGERDRFGMPEPAPGREIAIVHGDHRLTSDLEAVADAVRGWLATRLRTAAAG